MAVPQTTTDAMAKVDTETTNLGVEVGKLRAIISTSMSEADVASVNGFLGNLETRLKAIGTDPNVPVPPDPPPVFTRRK